jgi:hypothetical protein
MPFDMNEAIQLGQILQAAYEVPAEDLAQRAGEAIPSQYDPLNRGYKILSTIYGNDLITDWKPGANPCIIFRTFLFRRARLFPNCLKVAIPISR